MGQRPSNLGGSRFPNKTVFSQQHLTLPASWNLRRNRSTSQETSRNPNPEQPIKFQYKTRRKHSNQATNNVNSASTNHSASVNTIQTINNLKVSQSSRKHQLQVKNTNVNDKCFRAVNKPQNGPVRTKSEPTLAPSGRDKQHRHRRNKSAKARGGWDGGEGVFGYEIQDVDAFLTKATIEKPANIPVVLAFPSVLYQTRIGGYQAEIALPLGMVVNAVFKNQHWLYVQTPHAEEGYVSYAACLPLGIIPPPDDDAPAPCWEKSSDVFPKPSGNMTDTEKLSSKSECGGESRCHSRRSWNALSTCGEKSVDRLYLRAAASAKRSRGVRQTLLVITNDYFGPEKNALHVSKGDVVVLLGTHVRGWFWVRNKEGAEGFIPAANAGHGFL